MRQALLLMDFQRRSVAAIPGARKAMAAADRARTARDRFVEWQHLEA